MKNGVLSENKERHENEEKGIMKRKKATSSIQRQNSFLLSTCMTRKERKGVSGGKRERESERGRERETGRESESERAREKERERKSESERAKERENKRERERETE